MFWYIVVGVGSSGVTGYFVSVWWCKQMMLQNHELAQIRANAYTLGWHDAREFIKSTSDTDL